MNCITLNVSFSSDEWSSIDTMGVWLDEATLKNFQDVLSHIPHGTECAVDVKITGDWAKSDRDLTKAHLKGDTIFFRVTDRDGDYHDSELVELDYLAEKIGAHLTPVYSPNYTHAVALYEVGGAVKHYYVVLVRSAQDSEEATILALESHPQGHVTQVTRLDTLPPYVNGTADLYWITK